jgi:hypothetical protein
MNKFSKLVAGAFIAGVGLFSVLPAAASDPVGKGTEDISGFTNLPFLVSQNLVSSHKLSVPEHGAITVSATAHLHGPCSYNSYLITVVADDGSSAGPQDFSTSGNVDTKTWANLASGMYHLEFQLVNGDPSCYVSGNVNAYVSG